MTRVAAINLLLCYLGWVACVLPAANALPWIGPLALVPLLLVHFAFLSPDRRVDAFLLAAAAALGLSADALLVQFGLIAFPSSAQLLTPSPLWMVALWINFALTINLCLSFLAGKYLLASLFGLIAAPFAYLAGSRLGAMTMPRGIGAALCAVAMEWSLSMPSLLLVNSLLRRRFTPVQQRD